MSGFAAEDSFPVKRVRARFLASEKDRAHLHSFGAKRKRCRDTPGIGYTACRDYGDLYGVDCLRDECDCYGQRGFRGAQKRASVTTGFKTRGDYQIPPGLLECNRFI